MLGSFSRMLPELLRHSDRKDVFEKLPEHLKSSVAYETWLKSRGMGP